VNAIYFAKGIYCLEAAAEYYFSHSAGKRTNAQLLASIRNNPIYHFTQIKKDKNNKMPFPSS